jgi:hypothetical protein
MEEDYPALRPKRTSLTAWWLSVLVLLGPSFLVWFVRGTAYAAQCLPGPDLCRGIALGAGLRDALRLSWFFADNTLILIAISIVATLAAFRVCRPLLGTLSLLLLPIMTLVLPMLAVLTSKYEDCPVSTDGIGSCSLWGAQMGMSFHTAATVPDIIYGMAPYTFSLTLMLGLLGFFFARPRAAVPQHPMAQMRRIIDHDE